MVSAHKKFFGHEAVFTKHKYKDNQEGALSETLDYVWYTNGATDSDKKSRVKSVSQGYLLPPRHELPPEGNPTFSHPSDHYSLGFEFKLSR